jgi:hypothetical protein
MATHGFVKLILNNLLAEVDVLESDVMDGYEPIDR